MTTDPSNRERALVDKLLAEYKPGARGSSVDTDRIRLIVAADPDLVAKVFPSLLRWNRENAAGIWGLLFVLAMVYEKECRDDSLSVLIRASAKEANVAVPSILSVTPHDKPANGKTVELQMAEADVRAGDAHRVLTTMKIETMPVEVRDRVMGNCIISFPVANDLRPIQKIPEVRQFVADLHKRMRYFPMYLNFDQKYKMHLVYFGCLADETATRASGNEIQVDMLHNSYITRMRESLHAIRDTCRPLGLDWKRSVRGILGPFDRNTRTTVFGKDWDV
jgi:hypothetical protein